MNQPEQFVDHPYYSCQNCGSNSPNRCGTCPHCGLCETPNGKLECVPGDVNGPLFKSDCINYYHNFWYPIYDPLYYRTYGIGYPRYYNNRQTRNINHKARNINHKIKTINRPAKIEHKLISNKHPRK